MNLLSEEFQGLCSMVCIAICKEKNLSVLRIRIRIRIRWIRMFLGVLDPDPLVGGMDPDPAPDPDPPIIKQK
jgi:hypothetical protein